MDTTLPAFNWEATLSQGNKVIENHFTPWVETNGARYIDLPGSDLDRKFGIDEIVINLENGRARTVQVKQDSRISETGNIYLEVTKVLGSDRKKVVAQRSSIDKAATPHQHRLSPNHGGSAPESLHLHIFRTLSRKF